MARVFISYRRRDSATLATLLAKDLERHGIRAFVDTRQVDGGGPFPDRLRRAIEAADVFVCLLGATTLESEWVREEIAHAHQHGKVLIPLFQETYAAPNPIPDDHVFALLQSDGVHIMDVRNIFIDQAIADLTQMIRASGPRRFPLRAVALAAVILVAAAAAVLVVTNNNRSDPSAQSTTEVAQAAITDAPSHTPSLTDPPAAALTPTETDILNQIDPLQMAMQTQTREAELTRAALPTATHTPTTDFQATIDAISTATRAYFQTQEAERSAQATADAAATLTAQPTLDPLQAAYAQAAAYDYRAGNAAWTPITRDFDGVTMVLVPAGCFDMGSEDGSDDETPVHQQCFDAPFWIDRTEVTQADFERLGGVKAGENAFDGDLRPVENITWFEARDFCARRGARLPNEAEWEYAARGPDGLIYPWGNSWDENNAVWAGNSNDQTAEVGSRPAGASWVGALDMSGNVWEWVSSLYQPYPYEAADGREDDTGNRTDVSRVLRGGSWFDPNTKFLRAADRDWDFPVIRNNNRGFRCALS